MSPAELFTRLYLDLHTLLTIPALILAIVVVAAFLYRALRRRL